MTLDPLRLALPLLLTLVVSGCAHRLTGPLHPADEPPWIAAGLPSKTAEMEVLHRVLIIGDTGYFLEKDPTLEALGHWAAGIDSSSVLFLGDNIYNEGLTDDDREHGERILSQLLEATTGNKIFVPGNHDWGLLPSKQNVKSIRNQQAFVDQWHASRAEFIPKEGCMGPMSRTLFEGRGDQKAVVFIALDPTPWLNDRLDKNCPTPETKIGFLTELDAQLERHKDDFVVVGSHYPLLTGGPHGGLTYGLIADMIVAPIGWMIGGLANTYEPGYADWIAQTQAVLRRNPPEIYAAGHDHSLQLLDAGDVAGLYIVSGAGSEDRVSTVTDLPQTIFAHAAPGFVVVDFGRHEGREKIVIRVIEPGMPTPAYEMELQSLP